MLGKSGRRLVPPSGRSSLKESPDTVFLYTSEFDLFVSCACGNGDNRSDASYAADIPLGRSPSVRREYFVLPFVQQKHPSIRISDIDAASVSAHILLFLQNIPHVSVEIHGLSGYSTN